MFLKKKYVVCDLKEYKSFEKIDHFCVPLNYANANSNWN